MLRLCSVERASCLRGDKVVSRTTEIFLIIKPRTSVALSLSKQLNRFINRSQGRLLISNTSLELDLEQSTSTSKDLQGCF